MRRRPSFRFFAVVTLACFALSCATTNVPPISSTGAAFRPEKDEKRLWEASRVEEEKLLTKARVYDDPLLTDYLQGVVNRLNPPQMAANPEISYKVAVLEDPTLNAFAFPHGSLYVHTGLLARMQNEDQLATVLGHEMTHVEDRHMLRYQRSARNKQIGFGIAALTAAVIIAGEEGRAYEHGDYAKGAQIGVLSQILVGLGLQLAFIAAVNGYGRDLEREADEGGFQKMSLAGYDTREAPQVYSLLLEDHGDQGKAEAFFFGSHPRLAERINSAREWNATHPRGGPRTVSDADAQAFAFRMRPVVRDDARLNIELNRLGVAQDELDRVLKLMPGDPQAQLLLGRLRLRQADAAKDPGTRREYEDEARAALEEALRLDPDQAGAHRDLGLLSHRLNDKAAACAHFRRYLELAPQAEDAGKIRDYIVELQQTGACK